VEMSKRGLTCKSKDDISHDDVFGTPQRTAPMYVYPEALGSPSENQKLSSNPFRLAASVQAGLPYDVEYSPPPSW